jgi:CDP-glycerol glycerophosphotransferase
MRRMNPASTSDPKPRLALLEELQRGRDFEHLSLRVRKRRLVLFFGRAAFADNTKYAYLNALARERRHEVLWCTADDDLAAQLEAQGLPVLRLFADLDRTIDILLHAAVVLFSLNPHESLGGADALLGCLAGAKKIQLWHGVSVKRLTLQLIPHLGVRDRNLRAPWVASSGADVVLSTAQHFDAYWREVFGCRHLLRAGFPRNEVLVRAPHTLEMLGAQLPEDIVAPLHDGRPNVLVVPTWQRHHDTALTRDDFFAHALRFARTHKVNFFFKMHPTYFKRWEGAGAKTDGLVLLDPGTDIYPWMNRFDALVTDYSSIMFDYLLTGRPVLTLDLQPGDHQDFEPDYGLVPRGDEGAFRAVFTPATFAATLQRALFDDRGRDARLAYAARLFETDPAAASAQIMALVDALVEDSQQPDWNVITP